ncbi:MAG: hypothetical protein QOH30_1222, partial [Baekduia sp.]|nr:hypothetical protein [Baekduia sp.]
MSKRIIKIAGLLVAMAAVTVAGATFATGATRPGA